MSELMWRVAKHEGVGNIVLERVPIPEPGPRQVLVRTCASLISRGSELWARYERQEAVDPRMMGYSMAGVVVRVGAGVTELAPGDRVSGQATHAEYSVCAIEERRTPWTYGVQWVWPLDERLSFEEGTFHTLATSSAAWTTASQITERDHVVVLGQGIVGNLVMQFARRYRPAQLIAVDALELRCDLAREVGAPQVVNAAEEDPVVAVKRLTGGAGGNVVIDCVGGRAGLKSFAQAQDMLASGGLLHLIGVYHPEPLPLYSGKMMHKRVLGAFPPETSRVEHAEVAMAALGAADVRVKPLITHHFPGHQAKEAFDFLYAHPDQALGLVFEWQ